MHTTFIGKIYDTLRVRRLYSTHAIVRMTYTQCFTHDNPSIRKIAFLCEFKLYMYIIRKDARMYSRGIIHVLRACN